MDLQSGYVLHLGLHPAHQKVGPLGLSAHEFVQQILPSVRKLFATTFMEQETADCCDGAVSLTAEAGGQEEQAGSSPFS